MRSDHDPSPADAPHAVRNFKLLTLYQVLMRTGWIFKTESIIMPAVLDTLSGSAWMRGALPLLNRLGQSLSPLAFAPMIRRMPQKKWACAASVALMSLAFAGLASIWIVPGGTKSPWAPHLYLSLYGLFFACLGVNQTAQLTLQGKLIPARSRGRLLSFANGLGAVLAIGCAAGLLPLWLHKDGGDFQWLFGFTSALFAAGAIVMILPRESMQPPADDEPQAKRSRFFPFRTLQKNLAFRRAALVAFLYGTSTILFPHYQTMAQERLGKDLSRVIGWVVIQNIGTGAFSIPLGMIADRYGTRLVLRIVMFGICLIPPLALIMVGNPAWGEAGYNLVFLLIGISPVALRMFNEYALEVSPRDDHPEFLSTMSLCLSVPVLFSPLAGWIIDRAGFEPVFYVVMVLLVIGWLTTFTLSEPRKRWELEAVRDSDHVV